jgi:hypothetical protein
MHQAAELCGVAGQHNRQITTRARLLISLFTRSSGVVDHSFGQWLRGNAVKAHTSAWASSIKEQAGCLSRSALPLSATN